MLIATNSVVSIHYRLTSTEGEVLDASGPSQPLVYLHGVGNLIPGLERALLGRAAGDSFSVTIAPSDAYGERIADLVQQVPRDLFGEGQELAIGMRFSGNAPQGPINVTITAIEGDQITLDGNHPMAGRTLHFEVTVDAVREATEQELLHGHVHGAGCQH